MARFYGTVGFMQTVEDDSRPGMYFEKITEYPKRYGDILTNKWNSSPGKSINDDFKVANRISVVCNKKMISEAQFARYIIWNNVKWEITSVDIEPPRLIFTLGGIYNAQQA